MPDQVFSEQFLAGPAPGTNLCLHYGQDNSAGTHLSSLAPPDDPIYRMGYADWAEMIPRLRATLYGERAVGRLGPMMRNRPLPHLFATIPLLEDSLISKDIADWYGLEPAGGSSFERLPLNSLLPGLGVDLPINCLGFVLAFIRLECDHRVWPIPLSDGPVRFRVLWGVGGSLAVFGRNAFDGFHMLLRGTVRGHSGRGRIYFGKDVD
jgi:hypothetical protein